MDGHEVATRIRSRAIQRWDDRAMVGGDGRPAQPRSTPQGERARHRNDAEETTKENLDTLLD